MHNNHVMVSSKHFVLFFGLLSQEKGNNHKSFQHTSLIARSYSSVFCGRKPGSLEFEWYSDIHIRTLSVMKMM